MSGWRASDHFEVAAVLRSIATVSLGGGLQDKLYAIAAAGFDSVELTESAMAYSEMQPGDIRAQLDELGLSVVLFNPVAEFAGVPEDLWQRNIASLGRKFELMHRLGADLMRVPSYAGPSGVDSIDAIAGQLATLAKTAQAEDIRIGFEPIATGTIVSTCDDAWRVVESASSPNLGLVLDSFEILAGDSDPDMIASIPGDRIFLTQLADAPSLSVDVDTLSRHFRCFPGQGVLDLAGFVTRVVDSGYSGPFSLDVRSDIVRSAPPRAMALDAYRSLVHVEESLVRRGRRTSASLFAAAEPPAAQQREGVGFIEFAVDATDHDELGLWLQRLGFRRLGKHRSKDVTLFRQGDVAIVLNAGSDTFAHYYHHLHGTSVCAIGIQLSDPDAFLARADLYRYKRHEERIGPKEYSMPAVRAPDGSLIHALGEDYDPATDFEIEADDANAGAGLLRVDHLARAVPIDQFDSWVLFYRAMLGLAADQPVDLSDPHGIVHSRALHDSGNRLRMPLTFSDSSKTVVAKSLTRFGGAGVNQIAFETNDIFKAVESMRANGVPLLHVPANYYRNLVETPGIPEQRVAKLEEYGVLYDQDTKGGEFLHVYTELFRGRFFFEVVQRKQGYDRYGERNAPVRLAAQAKQHPLRV